MNGARAGERRPWMLGFTGHRAVADPAAASAAIRAQILLLKQEEAGPDLTAISSVASGADSLFAQSVLEIGIPWIALLPLPEEQFARDFEPGEWQIAAACLARATARETLSPSQARPDAYLETGIQMVDRSDVLIALWDGQPSRGKGGTAEIVAYARQRGIPVVWIDAGTLAVTRIGFEGEHRRL